MKTNSLRKAALATIAFSLLLSAAFSAPASAATPAKRYITVNSDGVVKAVPDAVRLNATVSVVAGNSKEALANTSATSAAVRAALKNAKIDAKDIASKSITVFPEYNYTQDKGQSLIGYRGSQSFIITIRKAVSAGAIVDAVVAAGGDNLQVDGVTPFVLDSTKAASAARSAAVLNAKAKAKSYAKLIGVKLGKVIYLVENSAPSSYRGDVLAYGKAESGGTVVDLGQQDVTVSITVQWEIK